MLPWVLLVLPLLLLVLLLLVIVVSVAVDAVDVVFVCDRNVATACSTSVPPAGASVTAYLAPFKQKARLPHLTPLLFLFSSKTPPAAASTTPAVTATTTTTPCSALI